MDSELEDYIDYFENHVDTRSSQGVQNIIDDIKDLASGERDPKDFRLEELMMALGLMAYLETKYNRYGGYLYDTLDAAALDIERGLVNTVLLENGLESFSSIFEGTLLSSKQESVMRSGLERTIRRGVAVNFDLQPPEITQSEIDAILDKTVGNAHYYARTSFRRIIEPRVRKTVSNLINQPDSAEAYMNIRDSIDKFYKNDPYSRLVANSYSNRAYNWGSLKGMQVRGIRRYRYQAVLDNRTSDICRELHGKEWEVADGLAHSEAVLFATEENIEIVDNYVSLEDVTGADLDKLRDMGALIPPNHCYAEGTEVYTDSGFKDFRDVDIKKDKVYSINLETRDIELVDIVSKIEQNNQYGGLIRVIIDNQIVQDVTYNHKFLVNSNFDKLTLYQAGTFKDMGSITNRYSFIYSNEFQTNFDDYKQSKLHKLELVENTNKVYCLELQKNKNMLVRYPGSEIAVWSGNSNCRSIVVAV